MRKTGLNVITDLMCESILLLDIVITLTQRHLPKGGNSRSKLGTEENWYGFWFLTLPSCVTSDESLNFFGAQSYNL